MGSGQASKVSLKKAGEVASSPTQQPFKSEVPTQFRTPYDGRAGCRTCLGQRRGIHRSCEACWSSQMEEYLKYECKLGIIPYVELGKGFCFTPCDDPRSEESRLTQTDARLWISVMEVRSLYKDRKTKPKPPRQGPVVTVALHPARNKVPVAAEAKAKSSADKKESDPSLIALTTKPNRGMRVAQFQEGKKAAPRYGSVVDKKEFEKVVGIEIVEPPPSNLAPPPGLEVVPQTEILDEKYVVYVLFDDSNLHPMKVDYRKLAAAWVEGNAKRPSNDELSGKRVAPLGLAAARFRGKKVSEGAVVKTCGQSDQGSVGDGFLSCRWKNGYHMCDWNLQNCQNPDGKVVEIRIRWDIPNEKSGQHNTPMSGRFELTLGSPAVPLDTITDRWYRLQDVPDGYPDTFIRLRIELSSLPEQYTCSVCYDDFQKKPKYGFVCRKDESHAQCIDCFRNYIRVCCEGYMMGKLPIKCPICKELISEKRIADLSTEEEWEKYILTSISAGLNDRACANSVPVTCQACNKYHEFFPADFQDTAKAMFKALVHDQARDLLHMMDEKKARFWAAYAREQGRIIERNKALEAEAMAKSRLEQVSKAIPPALDAMMLPAAYCRRCGQVDALPFLKATVCHVGKPKVDIECSTCNRSPAYDCCGTCELHGGKEEEGGDARCGEHEISKEVPLWTSPLENLTRKQIVQDTGYRGCAFGDVLYKPAIRISTERNFLPNSFKRALKPFSPAMELKGKGPWKSIFEWVGLKYDSKGTGHQGIELEGIGCYPHGVMKSRVRISVFQCSNLPGREGFGADLPGALITSVESVLPALGICNNMTCDNPPTVVVKFDKPVWIKEGVMYALLLEQEGCDYVLPRRKAVSVTDPKIGEIRFVEIDLAPEAFIAFARGMTKPPELGLQNGGFQFPCISIVYAKESKYSIQDVKSLEVRSDVKEEKLGKESKFKESNRAVRNLVVVIEDQAGDPEKSMIGCQKGDILEVRGKWNEALFAYRLLPCPKSALTFAGLSRKATTANASKGWVVRNFVRPIITPRKLLPEIIKDALKGRLNPFSDSPPPSFSLMGSFGSTPVPTQPIAKATSDIKQSIESIFSSNFQEPGLGDFTTTRSTRITRRTPVSSDDPTRARMLGITHRIAEQLQGNPNVSTPISESNPEPMRRSSRERGTRADRQRSRPVRRATKLKEVRHRMKSTQRSYGSPGSRRIFKAKRRTKGKSQSLSPPMSRPDRIFSSFRIDTKGEKKSQIRFPNVLQIPGRLPRTPKATNPLADILQDSPPTSTPPPTPPPMVDTKGAPLPMLDAKGAPLPMLDAKGAPPSMLDLPPKPLLSNNSNISFNDPASLLSGPRHVSSALPAPPVVSFQAFGTPPAPCVPPMVQVSPPVPKLPQGLVPPNLAEEKSFTDTMQKLDQCGVCGAVGQVRVLACQICHVGPMEIALSCNLCGEIGACGECGGCMIHGSCPAHKLKTSIKPGRGRLAEIVTDRVGDTVYHSKSFRMHDIVEILCTSSVGQVIARPVYPDPLLARKLESKGISGLHPYGWNLRVGPNPSLSVGRCSRSGALAWGEFGFSSGGMPILKSESTETVVLIVKKARIKSRKVSSPSLIQSTDTKRVTKSIIRSSWNEAKMFKEKSDEWRRKKVHESYRVAQGIKALNTIAACKRCAIVRRYQDLVFTRCHSKPLNSSSTCEICEKTNGYSCCHRCKLHAGSRCPAHDIVKPEVVRVLASELVVKEDASPSDPIPPPPQNIPVPKEIKRGTTRVTTRVSTRSNLLQSIKRSSVAKLKKTKLGRKIHSANPFSMKLTFTQQGVVQDKKSPVSPKNLTVTAIYLNLSPGVHRVCINAQGNGNEHFLDVRRAGKPSRIPLAGPLVEVSPIASTITVNIFRHPEFKEKKATRDVWMEGKKDAVFVEARFASKTVQHLFHSIELAHAPVSERKSDQKDEKEGKEKKMDTYGRLNIRTVPKRVFHPSFLGDIGLPLDTKWKTMEKFAKENFLSHFSRYVRVLARTQGGNWLAVETVQAPGERGEGPHGIFVSRQGLIEAEHVESVTSEIADDLAARERSAAMRHRMMKIASTTETLGDKLHTAFVCRVPAKQLINQQFPIEFKDPVSEGEHGALGRVVGNAKWKNEGLRPSYLDFRLDAASSATPALISGVVIFRPTMAKLKPNSVGPKISGDVELYNSKDLQDKKHKAQPLAFGVVTEFGSHAFMFSKPVMFEKPYLLKKGEWYTIRLSLCELGLTKKMLSPCGVDMPEYAVCEFGGNSESDTPDYFEFRFRDTPQIDGLSRGDSTRANGQLPGLVLFTPGATPNHHLLLDHFKPLKMQPGQPLRIHKTKEPRYVRAKMDMPALENPIASILAPPMPKGAIVRVERMIRKDMNLSMELCAVKRVNVNGIEEKKDRKSAKDDAKRHSIWKSSSMSAMSGPGSPVLYYPSSCFQPVEEKEAKTLEEKWKEGEKTLKLERQRKSKARRRRASRSFSRSRSQSQKRRGSKIRSRSGSPRPGAEEKQGDGWEWQCGVCLHINPIEKFTGPAALCRLCASPGVFGGVDSPEERKEIDWDEDEDAYDEELYDALAEGKGEGAQLGIGEDELTGLFFECQHDKCGNTTCLQCLRTVAKNQIMRHDCNGGLQTLSMYKELVRVMTEAACQICESCGQLGVKDLACTHISCFCGEKWCYMCGKIFKNFSKHNEYQDTKDGKKKIIGRCTMYLHQIYGNPPARALERFHYHKQLVALSKYVHESCPKGSLERTMLTRCVSEFFPEGVIPKEIIDSLLSIRNKKFKKDDKEWWFDDPRTIGLFPEPQSKK